MKQWINVILLIAFALISIWCTGDLMRKNDQAVILAGAYDLADGRAQEWGAYYQYDKTYVLYWVSAAIFKVRQLVRCNVDPVAVANMGLVLVFWSALAVFVVRFRKTLTPLPFLCFLTAPVVLLNTLYVNSSVLSSAFLLLSAVFLFWKKGRGGWLAALFFALAVGSRADILLLLPLLLWIITPLPIVGKTVRDFSRHWKLIGGGLLALGIGPLLCGESGVSLDVFFSTKVVVGYIVFGFGAAGLVFLTYALRLLLLMLRTRVGLEKNYYIVGLAALLLPALFFLPQLHTPRYFWRACEAVLLLSASGRLSVANRRMTIFAVGLVAVLPLIVGLRLPSLNRPQITVLQPTLFPSGDGHYPMGGTIPFMFRLRNASSNPVDHNQRVWKAVQRTEFEVDGQSLVPVLCTPMSGYLLLGASLQGKTAQRASFEELAGTSFYVDSRSLMRDDPKTPLHALSQILVLPTHFVSPVLDGIGILEVGIGDGRWGRQTRLLNRLFAGNEYRVINMGAPASSERKTITFSERFSEGFRQDEQTGLYYSEGCAPFAGQRVRQASAVFPFWMSLRAFRDSDQ